MIVSSFLWTKHRNVTDRQTDRNAMAITARHALQAVRTRCKNRVCTSGIRALTMCFLHINRPVLLLIIHQIVASMGPQVTAVSRSYLYNRCISYALSSDLCQWCFESTQGNCRLNYCNTLLAGKLSAECRGSFSVRSRRRSILLQHYTHTPLAEDRLQDCDSRVEMYPWRRSCLFAGTLYTSGKCLRWPWVRSASTGC